MNVCVLDTVRDALFSEPLQAVKQRVQLWQTAPYTRGMSLVPYV